MKAGRARAFFGGGDDGGGGRRERAMGRTKEGRKTAVVVAVVVEVIGTGPVKSWRRGLGERPRQPPLWSPC